MTGKNAFDNEKSAPSDKCDVDLEYNRFLESRLETLPLLFLLSVAWFILFRREIRFSYQDDLKKILIISKGNYNL
jgi:hypothetical protein